MTANLLSTLQGLTQPSREVDAAIFAAMGEPLPEKFLGMNIKLERQKDGSYTMPVGNMQVRFEVPAFTASLDAAIALCERVLPGAWYLIGKGKTRSTEPLYGAQIMFGSDEVLGDGEHDATPAIALCLALLRATEARDATR